MLDATVERPAPEAFSRTLHQIALGDLMLLRPVTDSVRKSRKFAQIAASIREIGVVEPLVITPDRQAQGKFRVLDGHLRLEVLKELGEPTALCIMAKDDEGYTFNSRLNRIAIIQEHKMILNAIERGVPEERIAAVFHVNPDNIRRKRRLLDGICTEAASLLEDKHVPLNSFDALRKMLPERQVEAAELMVAMNNFTVSYAKTLLAATPDGQLVPGKRARTHKGVTEEQLSLMRRESASLDRDFRLIEETYGADHLDLVLAKGYLARLVENSRVAKYLREHHREIALEFIRIVERQATAA
jgi:hypothetical protein